MSRPRRVEGAAWCRYSFGLCIMNGALRYGRLFINMYLSRRIETRAARAEGRIMDEMEEEENQKKKSKDEPETQEILKKSFVVFLKELKKKNSSDRNANEKFHDLNNFDECYLERLNILRRKKNLRFRY